MIEFVKKAIKIFGRGKYKVVSFPEGRKKIEIGDYVADYSKFKFLLGWSPKVNLDKGILKTIKFYEKNKKYYW